MIAVGYSFGMYWNPLLISTICQQVNTANQNIETTSQLLMNYRRNVQFNLESTNSLKPPIGVPELAKSHETK